MSERFVDVAGCRLFTVDEGDGPPIVLLHAGVADLRSWDALAPLLVAAGYRVVRYDARGFGRSPTEDVEFSHRADLLAVMDALGIGRTVLVGNSRGGVLAFDTAIETPGARGRRRGCRRRVEWVRCEFDARGGGRRGRVAAGRQGRTVRCRLP